ncbi:MAG: ribonuclease P protein component [Patescibacteria group bacterium]|nr:ribonuclease P protein component [Patescibacteria group bacterium]
MFNQNNRLRKTKEIEKTFKNGKSFYSNVLGFKVLKNDLNESRFCVIISAKISKKAVERNKIKRRIRAIVNRDLKQIKKGFDIIIIVTKNIINLEFSGLSQEVEDSFKKIGVYDN